jgi:hypothetical protein
LEGSNELTIGRVYMDGLVVGSSDYVVVPEDESSDYDLGRATSSERSVFGNRAANPAYC